MIKKFFSISIIAASIAVAGCSSNDDDDETPPVTGGMEMPGGGEQPGVPAQITVPTDYTPAEGVTLSLAETFTNPPTPAEGEADTFNTLLQAAADAGLSDALAGDGPLTIFAPTDAAFAALGAENIPTDQAVLSNILQYHIVSGALDGGLVAGSVGSSAEALNGGSLAVTQDDDSQLRIAGAALTRTDIQTTNGIIHVIDAVLLPPAANEPEQPPEQNPGNENPEPNPPVEVGADNLGAALNGLRDQGYTDFVSLFTRTDLGTSLDGNTWTAFVPNNEAISEDALNASPELAREILVDHILVEGAFTAEQLATGGDRTANGGAVLTFGGTAGALTVNGFSATAVSVAGAASTIYIIDGVITE